MRTFHGKRIDGGTFFIVVNYFESVAMLIYTALSFYNSSIQTRNDTLSLWKVIIYFFSNYFHSDGTGTFLNVSKIKNTRV